MEIIFENLVNKKLRFILAPSEVEIHFFLLKKDRNESRPKDETKK